MAVDLTRHFENLRYLLTLYVKYNNNPGEAFDSENSGIFVNLTSLNNQQDNQINILNFQQAFEIGILILNINLLVNDTKIIDQTQHVYIRYSFQILMASFQAGLDDQFNSNTIKRLIFYIFFNIILVIIYFIFWIPLVSKLNRDVRILIIATLIYIK